MSKNRETALFCPNCSQTVVITENAVINTGEQPSLKQKIINGELYDYSCPKCGGVIHHVHETLFHDVDDKIMIYSVHPDNLYKIIRTFNLAREQNGHAYQTYRLRAVTTPTRLREKVIIFNAGLDDRVIEIIKFSELSAINTTFSNLNLNRGYFYVDDGKFYIEFVGDGDDFIRKEIPADTYDFIRSYYSAVIDNDASIVVDSFWAENAVSDMHDGSFLSSNVKSVIEEVYSDIDDDSNDETDLSNEDYSTNDSLDVSTKS